MEIHHHSHAAPAHGGTSRKKWTHYFWEFLMLFLAVFCGFLAEYALEHKIERERENVYIRSMIDDLTADTTNLAKTINSFNELLKGLDTVISMHSIFSKGYNDTLWRNLYALSSFPDFIHTDRTMQQLKNSGGMRLIHRKRAADGITDYDSKVKDLGIDVDALSEILFHLLHFSFEVLDLEDLNQDRKNKSPADLENGNKNYLLISDRATLGKLYNEISLYRSVEVMVQRKETELKQKAVDLITLLKKEYHLK